MTNSRQSGNPDWHPGVTTQRSYNVFLQLLSTIFWDMTMVVGRKCYFEYMPWWCQDTHCFLMNQSIDWTFPISSIKVEYWWNCSLSCSIACNKVIIDVYHNLLWIHSWQLSCFPCSFTRDEHPSRRYKKAPASDQNCVILVEGYWYDIQWTTTHFPDVFAQQDLPFKWSSD